MRLANLVAAAALATVGSLAPPPSAPRRLRKLRASAPMPAAPAAADDARTRVAVCMCRKCAERGAQATMSAVVGLAGERVVVETVDGPGTCSDGPVLQAFVPATEETLEFTQVNSVDAVAALLSTYLGVAVAPSAATSLNLNFAGNACLARGEISQAIACYDAALQHASDQEGVLLVMRATAQLQRALINRGELTNMLKTEADAVPDAASQASLIRMASKWPTLLSPLLFGGGPGGPSAQDQTEAVYVGRNAPAATTTTH